MVSKAVGLIGLGHFGQPLARHLLQAGLNVATTRCGTGGHRADLGVGLPDAGSPLALAEVTDILVTCLPSAARLEEVLYSKEGILSAQPAKPLIDFSTLPLTVKAATQEALVARGTSMLDAQISGTTAMFEQRRAVVYASGDRALYDEHELVLQAVSSDTNYVGPTLEASKYTLVAQFLADINATSTAEAMVYAHRAGLDLGGVAAIIGASHDATSGQFQMQAPLMARREPQALPRTAGMLVNEVEEILTYGQQIGAPTDLLAVAADHYRQLVTFGGVDADVARLFESLLKSPTL